ncbi:MAG TPA: 2-dehydropantoate 2-reductase [Thermoanaerobaculia bacterium]|nr:2-dehydropantoate 2-reductase [Thermoanaerobaculia bacterium]
MRVAIFGTGGVGGYFGGRLALAGADVTFIARGAHLDAIRTSGLAVESPAGNFVISPARAESDPAPVGAVDFVLVGTKAWQVTEAGLAMRPMIGAQTIVIPLQNGVEATPQLTASLGADHVAPGLCRISSFVAGPGRIRHVGVTPEIAFNWIDGRSDSRLEALRCAFASAGVAASIPGDIEADLWAKLALISSMSGVGAVTRAPVGVQRSVPETRRLLDRAIHETAAVARARGVALAASLEDTTLRYIDTLPLMMVASMHRDIAEGRPSELEFQNGSVVRLGRGSGVPVPVHEFIYSSLLPLEQRARGQLQF